MTLFSNQQSNYVLNKSEYIILKCSKRKRVDGYHIKERLLWRVTDLILEDLDCYIQVSQKPRYGSIHEERSPRDLKESCSLFIRPLYTTAVKPSEVKSFMEIISPTSLGYLSKSKTYQRVRPKGQFKTQLSINSLKQYKLIMSYFFFFTFIFFYLLFFFNLQ